MRDTPRDLHAGRAAIVRALCAERGFTDASNAELARLFADGEGKVQAICPSAVSRELTRLAEAGKIERRRRDNRHWRIYWRESDDTDATSRAVGGT